MGKYPVAHTQELGAEEASAAFDLQLIQEESEAPEQVRQERSQSWQPEELVRVKAVELQTHEEGAIPLN